MLLERSVKVGHCTIYRWVQFYAPKILDKLKWYWKPTLGHSWKVDETYVKVKGKWVYLYRAIDKAGNTVNFYSSTTSNSNAAKKFLSKALNSIPVYSRPKPINTDKNPAYGNSISELKLAGKWPPDLEHRQVKYHNNIIESEHGKLKRLINPTLGFKSIKTAFATIKGFELMRIFKSLSRKGAYANRLALLGHSLLLNRYG